ncbi:hypothetical protein U1Q18_032036 [Sarracenia purpurea var. burkii]
MGISFSCPLSAFNDLENGFESVILESISFGDDDAKTPVRSISFKIQPTMFQSNGSRKKMMREESVRLKVTETETFEAPPSKEMNNQSPRLNNTNVKITESPSLDLGHPNHEAATTLQKVYKSFRTRRKLADCAVLIEQSWWKLLDFAELKRSSISFFDIEKHETAVSRWSRARTRAAKVGKGLLKNSRAQKLALQHWLEAIHGIVMDTIFISTTINGSTVKAKNPSSTGKLDIGEGKEVNLVDKCPRSKLQQQCIKYLGPMERKAYEVIVVDGKLLYKQSGELLDTTGEPKGAKWIFVLSTSMNLYVGQKKKGSFQHSSFLAGGATSAAGRIIVENGTLKAVWPHSGHYRPTPENFQDFVSFLKRNHVDLTDVEMDPVDDDVESLSKQNSVFLRSISSEEDFLEKDGLQSEHLDGKDKTSEKTSSTEEDDSPSPEPPQRRPSKLKNLSIPDRDDFVERLKFKSQADELSTDILAEESPLDGYETAEELPTSEPDEMVSEQSLSDEEDEEINEAIPEEFILRRINSHKEMNSYQLGKHLSCRWTTGAGPRIGCVRDYPSKLQCRALEQLKLSPRNSGNFRSVSSRESTPNSLDREIRVKKTSFSGELPRIRHQTPQLSPLCRGSPAPRNANWL